MKDNNFEYRAKKEDKSGQLSGAERKAATQFKLGNTANLSGRPQGSKNRATRILEAMIDGQAEAVMQSMVANALAGDVAAAKFILERCVAPRKERPMQIDLPDTSTIEGVQQAQSTILQAVANGEIFPTEATILSNLTENRRKALETVELESRIAALEANKYGE